MAKNTFSSSFRKIDVDQGEYNFKEEESDQTNGGPPGADEAEVNRLLQQGKYADALNRVLINAPLGAKNPQKRENALTLTLRVLMAIKPSHIEEAIKPLSNDLIDILMKYIYRGYEYPTEGSSGHLLLWHEKVFNVGGHGSIMRVLTDTRRI